LARLARVGFWLSLAFLSASWLGLVAGGRALQPGVGRLIHLAGTLLTLLTWRLLARLDAPSDKVLEWLGASTNFVLALTFTAMGYFLPQPGGMYTALMIGVYLAIGRAILVPSSPRKTLFLAALSLAPVPIARALVPNATIDAMVDFSLWSAGAVWLSAGTSGVIYGLQQRVKAARRLGQYELGARLGSGGMGEVYLAEHALLRRPTAIKVLQPGRNSEQDIQRFEREVRLTAALSHPNTVTIFDYGRAQDGSFFYAMELIEGYSLSDLVDRAGPQPAARVVHLLAQVADALEEAHAAQLIHRDIKPANLMVCERGGRLDVIKVLDFGLVRKLDADDSIEARADVIMGTPMYMSPEAITDSTSVDGRSDLYALGAVGYYLVTGQDVFSGQTVMEVCSKHLFAEPRTPSEALNAPVPEGLEDVLLSCLAKDPKARPQTAFELAQALRELDDCGAWSAEDARSWWRAHPRAAARVEPPQGRVIEHSQIADRNGRRGQVG
jgi:serine/threonine-protein kinase